MQIEVCSYLNHYIAHKNHHQRPTKNFPLLFFLLSSRQNNAFGGDRLFRTVIPILIGLLSLLLINTYSSSSFIKQFLNFELQMTENHQQKPLASYSRNIS